MKLSGRIFVGQYRYIYVFYSDSGLLIPGPACMMTCCLDSSMLRRLFICAIVHPDPSLSARSRQDAAAQRDRTAHELQQLQDQHTAAQAALQEALADAEDARAARHEAEARCAEVGAQLRDALERLARAEAHELPAAVAAREQVGTGGPWKALNYPLFSCDQGMDCPQRWLVTTQQRTALVMFWCGNGDDDVHSDSKWQWKGHGKYVETLTHNYVCKHTT